MILEATRRRSRRAVELLRDALVEYDRALFSSVRELSPAPEQNFQVIRDRGTYVLRVTDPTVDAK